ncbi:hypothetical protein TCAL_02933 [Tigriopus californicus]|uniref:Nuclear receptor domain-containing protein n=1 Tax=Tigriopus californicus TaxID=6832 RepID=A0A553NQQ7_TIGCA|nr:nuclear receptor ROR-alpha A-like [Tigriopus californicus]TRY67719.1 hypothetical protein TCAL_02933 [Tigriopus californicus]|eukprot:TCALIF_02933-PA protein Name:"Similar to nhr-3 Nuclear hormone receptor family member nhr-3 (Caenorhabditis elegans)" AED:0.29 eAED:0.30 QI:0/-1/0/1/-1/1/1/0/541
MSFAMDPAMSEHLDDGTSGMDTEDVSMDPTEECQICQDPAIRHLHYGAITCFSCKAFFRRTSQSKAYEKFMCKSTGECNVLHKLRKKCRKCRYEKCIRVGMKPSLVLSDEEKVKRFKKSLSKKAMDKDGFGEGPSLSPRLGRANQQPLFPRMTERNESILYSSGSYPNPPPAQFNPVPMVRERSSLECLSDITSDRHFLEREPKPTPYYEPTMSTVPKSKEICAKESNPRFVWTTASEASSPPLTETCDIGRDPEHRDECRLIPQPMDRHRRRSEITEDEVFLLQKLEYIHDSNYQSVAFGEELVKALVMTSAFGIPLTPGQTMMAYRLMIQRVTKVAQGFDEFRELPIPDQTSLLKSNADLMVSLKGAVFFDKRNMGIDQILFSMGLDDIEMAKRMIMSTSKTAGCKMNHIDYKSYNTIQELNDTPDEERYQWLLAQIGEVITSFPSLTKVLTYVVLLCPEDCQLIQRDKVQSMQYTIMNLTRKMIYSQYNYEVATNIYGRVTNIIDYLRELMVLKKKRPLTNPVHHGTDNNCPPSIQSH